MTARPRVLAVLPHVIPSTTLYLLKPLRLLDRAGSLHAEFALEYWVSREQVQRSDVVMFCRNVEPAYSAALDAAIELGKPILYDLDDDLFEMPEYAREDRHYADSKPQHQLRRYLEAATLVRVYSEPLRQRVAAINSHVVRVVGPVDWSLVPTSLPSRTNERVKIVYATGRTRDALGDMFAQELAMLLAKYPDRVELDLWGYASPSLARHPTAHRREPITDYDRFFRQFARAGYDIGLAPLRNDAFHLSKSNVKFREYAACRIAGIYSDVPVYAECVENRVTGLLVSDQPGEWRRAIECLIQDGDLRSSIQERAQAYAREHYGYDQFCALLLEQIRCLVADATGRQSEIALPAGNESPTVFSFGKVLAHWFRRLPRLWTSFRVNGARGALERARWALNDLPILFWKGKHG